MAQWVNRLRNKIFVNAPPLGVGKTWSGNGSGSGSGSGRCVGKTGIWEREITWSGYLFYY